MTLKKHKYRLISMQQQIEKIMKTSYFSSMMTLFATLIFGLPLSPKPARL